MVYISFTTLLCLYGRELLMLLHSLKSSPASQTYASSKHPAVSQLKDLRNTHPGFTSDYWKWKWAALGAPNSLYLWEQSSIQWNPDTPYCLPGSWKLAENHKLFPCFAFQISQKQRDRFATSVAKYLMLSDSIGYQHWEILVLSSLEETSKSSCNWNWFTLYQFREKFTNIL